MPESELIHLLTKSGSAQVDIKGVQGYLVGVIREDGSGRSFGLTIRTPDRGLVTVYIRTY